MAYKGKYTIKHKDKYLGDPTKVVYRSLWERQAFKWCENSPRVKKWNSEEIVVPYKCKTDNILHRYYVDLLVEFDNRDIVLVEIKPKKETLPPKPGKQGIKGRRYISESLTYVRNMNKWKAADNFAKDRGWQFQVWTEDTLAEMGIMQKWKKMKKLKPLKRI